MSSPTLTTMLFARAPQTWEAYLNYAMLGQPPASGELHPEEEASLPEQFRREGL
jgi:hypothetical protein